MSDEGLLQNPAIRWLSDDDLVEVGRRAEAEVDAARAKLAWADQSLDILAAGFAERVRRVGHAN